MSKPMAVVISDIHYTLNTLELADAALRAAIDLASELKVPLIECGDLTNDKAMLRAEVVNRLITTFKYARLSGVKCYSLVGNHSLINEKSSEHSLYFLKPYTNLIDSHEGTSQFNFISYKNSSESFMEVLKYYSPRKVTFAHQGTIGGQLGHYIQDPSSYDPKEVPEYRIFNGHFHNHYENGNTVSIGNPYTLTFGEANDHPKGFLVVYEDGSYKHIPTNLRKHIVIELNADTLNYSKFDYKTGDLVRVDVTGSKTAVESISRDKIAQLLGLDSFKVVLKPNDLSIERVEQDKSLTPINILDNIIDRTKEETQVKEDLKTLYRTFL